MQAQVGTDSQSVSPDIYECLLHVNRKMHRLPYFRSSRPRLHRQHQPKTPEIVDRFGNNKRALR